MALVLPAFNEALGTIPLELDLVQYAAGVAALGLAGMVLIPGAIGFTMMAGALTLFAASLLLLVPLMPVLDKLGDIGVALIHGPQEGGGEAKGEAAGPGNEEVIKKLDELIYVIRQGGTVTMDGKAVGKVIQMASGPIGS